MVSSPVVRVATKTATARTLRVSTATLERLLRAQVPANFEFDDNEPIVVDLVPGMRR